MICERCKYVIVDPIAHEYCTFSAAPPEDYPHIISAGAAPHHPGKEAKPVQKPITHTVAPPTAKPPIIDHILRYSYEDIDEGYRDIGSKLIEE